MPGEMSNKSRKLWEWLWLPYLVAMIIVYWVIDSPWITWPLFGASSAWFTWALRREWKREDVIAICTSEMVRMPDGGSVAFDRDPSAEVFVITTRGRTMLRSATSELERRRTDG